MHDHLADLAILGILDRHVRNEGRAGGQYYEYAFNVPLELVIRVVMDFEGVAFPREVRMLKGTLDVTSSPAVNGGASTAGGIPTNVLD